MCLIYIQNDNFPLLVGLDNFNENHVDTQILFKRKVHRKISPCVILGFLYLFSIPSSEGNIMALDQHKSLLPAINLFDIRHLV